jgi:hypothetical protein
MYDIFFVTKNNKPRNIKNKPSLAKFCYYENNKSEAIFQAQKKSFTKMFWIVDDNVELTEDFDFDFKIEEWDQKYVHIFKQTNGNYGGIFLIPKDYKITKREIEYRFFVSNKEVDIIASSHKTYDVFYVSSYEDFIDAQNKSTTSMFYAILDDVVVDVDFDFDLEIPAYDEKYVHIFKQTNGNYGGIFLIPKDYKITKREIEYRFFVSNKEVDIIASKNGFEIVFISYNEPNAERNWKLLKDKFPYAKRVDKIKGIHKAHIEAARKTNTSMIWVVDGDAIVKDDFNFDIEIPKWDREITHVCKSQNPINGLIYGYGGIKLLPRKQLLGISLDTVDMTTSITKDFKTLDMVSNITNFNTDPFNTWKSAFRECVKLSSKIINGQIDDETYERLEIWCTEGENEPFGKYAIKGALSGRNYGTKNKSDKEALLKINDWEWLRNEFERSKFPTDSLG